MIKTVGVCALVLILLSVGAYAETDLSPYTTLLSQIEQKEAALEDAYLHNDADTILALMGELESLRRNMSSSQMRVLAKYYVLGPILDESEYLVQQADPILGASSSPLREGLVSLTQNISDIDALYASGDYTAALSAIRQVEMAVIGFPALVATTAANNIPTLKSSLGGAGQTPSVGAMLENARVKFSDAKTLYDKSSAILLSRGFENADVAKMKALIEEARQRMSEGRSVISEGFDLVARAKELNGQGILGLAELAILVGPIVVVLVLVGYLKMQFKKPAITFRMSKSTVPADKETEVYRRIDITNTEESEVLMNVSDSLLPELEVLDISPAPTKNNESSIFWEVGVPPKKKITISYKLKIPALPAGKVLRFNAATVSYEVDGGIKKTLGGAVEIRAV